MKPSKYKRAAGTGPEKAEKRARVGFIGLKGEQGPKGDQGVRGPIGPVGPTGTFDDTLTAADIPELPAEKITSGTLDADRVEYLAGITPGTVTASKAMVASSDKDISGVRLLTIDGGLNKSAIEDATGSGITNIDQYFRMVNASARNFVIGNGNDSDGGTDNQLVLCAEQGGSLSPEIMMALKQNVGATIANGLTVKGGINTTNTVSGGAGTFSGGVSGTTGTFTGGISGTTGTFSDDVTLTGTDSGITVNDGDITTSSGTISGTTASFGSLTLTTSSESLTIGQTAIGEGAIGLLDGMTNNLGTVQPTRVVVPDTSKDIDGFRNITATGTITANEFSGNLTGNADTVTNGVYTTGDQTIAGTKTFTGNITAASLALNSIRLFVSSTYIVAKDDIGVAGSPANEWGRARVIQSQDTDTLTDITPDYTLIDSTQYVKFHCRTGNGITKAWRLSLTNTSYAGIYRIQVQFLYENTSTSDRQLIGISADTSVSSLDDHNFHGIYRDAGYVRFSEASERALNLDFLVHLNSTDLADSIVFRTYADSGSNRGTGSHIFDQDDSSSDLITNWTPQAFQITWTYMGPA